MACSGKRGSQAAVVIRRRRTPLISAGPGLAVAVGQLHRFIAGHPPLRAQSCRGSGQAARGRRTSRRIDAAAAGQAPALHHAIEALIEIVASFQHGRARSRLRDGLS